jgi:hypothetical protein
MNILSPENCALLDRTKLNDQPMAAMDSVFQVPRMVDRRPWLAHAFTELLQAQRIGRVDAGIGDFRLTDDTLNMAGRVLGSVRFRFLPSPSISALPGGGIQITWSNGGDALEVSVFPDEGVGVAHLVDDVPVEATELKSSEYGRMNVFLADLIGCTQ